MWRAIFRPDVLFTVATLQALSPYLFWQFGIGEFRGQSNLTYVPLWIWLAGWLAFMAGTRLVRERHQPATRFRIAPSVSVLNIATVLVMVVICAQLVSLVRLYGGIPILSYLRNDGAIQIGTAVALQEDSSVGQVGSVYVTTAVLHAMVVLLLIRNLERGRRDQLLMAAALLVLLAAHAINAKRQGFFRCAVYILTGLSMYAGDPLAALTRATKLAKTKAGATVWILALASVLFLSFGYLAYIRNQGHYKRDSLDELIAYQEYSLINFEVQCANAGFGPHQTNLLMAVRRLVPWKLMEAARVGDPEMPARYEPWAPAGLYEDIQWSLGLPGSVVYGFLLGVGTMACYRRALSSPFFLLAYCQVTFSLMLVHSFNEFLSLSWIPAPLAIFWFLSLFLKRSSAPVICREDLVREGYSLG